MTFCGIAMLKCSSVRHLQSPRRSDPKVIPALFWLLLTLVNYTPKDIIITTIIIMQLLISDPTLCSFNRVNVDDAELLGAPLFASRVLDTAWASRCSEISRSIDRLKLICAQDALTLLRVLFSAPRVQHLIRCSPSLDNPALADFDKLLRSAISHLNQLWSVRWAVATSVFTYQDGWFRSEKGVVARTSGLSGIGCEHCITSEYHFWFTQTIRQRDAWCLSVKMAVYSRRFL